MRSAGMRRSLRELAYIFWAKSQVCQVSGEVAHGGQRQGPDGRGVGEGDGDEMRSRLNWAVSSRL